jgi:hypothetical protein
MAVPMVMMVVMAVTLVIVMLVMMIVLAVFVVVMVVAHGAEKVPQQRKPSGAREQASNNFEPARRMRARSTGTNSFAAYGTS